jgi:hypothetical protein
LGAESASTPPTGIEHRLARARARFGDRDEIIRRARLEERIDRAA